MYLNVINPHGYSRNMHFRYSYGLWNIEKDGIIIGIKIKNEKRTRGKYICKYVGNGKRGESMSVFRSNLRVAFIYVPWIQNSLLLDSERFYKSVFKRKKKKKTSLILFSDIENIHQDSRVP